MKRSYYTLILLVVSLSALTSLLLSCHTPPRLEGPFVDEFEGSLAEGWSWIREHPSHWRIKNGALEIRVVPGKAETVENALVRSAPDRGKTAYTVEVSITNIEQPIQQYEQAGITLYKKGGPFFKLVKEFVDGQPVIIPGFAAVEGAKVHLRLEVRADTYRALYRTDKDSSYRIASEGELPPPDVEQISLQCYDGPPDAEHWFRFDDFRIRPQPPQPAE